MLSWFLAAATGFCLVINFHYSSDELASARGKYSDQDPRTPGEGGREGGEGDSSSIFTDFSNLATSSVFEMGL